MARSRSPIPTACGRSFMPLRWETTRNSTVPMGPATTRRRYRSGARSQKPAARGPPALGVQELARFGTGTTPACTCVANARSTCTWPLSRCERYRAPRVVGKLSIFAGDYPALDFRVKSSYPQPSTYIHSCRPATCTTGPRKPLFGDTIPRGSLEEVLDGPDWISHRNHSCRVWVSCGGYLAQFPCNNIQPGRGKRRQFSPRLY